MFYIYYCMSKYFNVLLVFYYGDVRLGVLIIVDP